LSPTLGEFFYESGYILNWKFGKRFIRCRESLPRKFNPASLDGRIRDSESEARGIEPQVAGSLFGCRRNFKSLFLIPHVNPDTWVGGVRQ